MNSRCGIALILLCLLTSSAFAAEVFVGNRPFEGRVYGVGQDIRLSLSDLAEALNLRLREDAQGWSLAGVKVPTRLEQDTVWVRLADLPPSAVRVIHNTQVGTIDLYRQNGAESASSETWGAEGTLVVFTAIWCPACQAMKGTLGELERSRQIELVEVDVDNRRSTPFRRYQHLFEGDQIPFFVMLDAQGRKVHSFTGFQTYNELLQQLEAHR